MGAIEDRRFPDSYDLYRPTIATSDSGVQSVTEPAEATSSDQPCRWLGAPPVGFTADMVGLTQDFDAKMLVPVGADIRAGIRGEQPDHVKYGDEMYVVRQARGAAGRGKYRTVLLTERGG